MELTCTICGTVFQRKKQGGPTPLTCGSEVCRKTRHAQSVRDYRWRQRGGSTTQVRTCGECGAEFVYVRTPGMRGAPPAMCSDECRDVSARRSRNQAARNFYARHREERGEEWKKYRRSYQLARKYGLDEAGYDRLLADQGGACAICRASDPGHWTGKFMVDHDHVGGAVRGLLCSNCNRALGLLGDAADVLMAAAAYLRKAAAVTDPAVS